MSNSIEPTHSASPARRAWARFRRNRLGFNSLVVFVVLVVLSLAAELVSSDKPLVVRYQGQWYTPMWQDYPETTFGGDFETATDYLDPFIRAQLTQGDNWAIYPLNPYGPRTINYFAPSPNPSPPTFENWLGTDDRGRDLLAQLVYGFRVSVLFALALTAIGVVLGVLAGAVQGYFGGKTDLAFQRFIEVWGSMPELYLLIIFSAVFAPSVGLLLLLLSLFGWMGLSDYVRAEFLRNRQLDYVRAAKALGFKDVRILINHILPNIIGPIVVIAAANFASAILVESGLSFLGLGAQPPTPSWGSMIKDYYGDMILGRPYLALIPGMAIMTIVLAFMMVGNGIRDYFDVK